MSQTIAARRQRQREGSFVGRSAEQQLFRTTLQQLAALRDSSDDELSDDDLTYAQIFLIAAEGGMGKSALLRRFGEIVRENKEGANAAIVSLDWEQHPTVQNHDDIMHVLHDVLCKSGFAPEMKPYHDAVERRKTVRKKAVDVEERFGHFTDFGAKTIQVASGGLVDKEWAADGIHAGAKGLAGLRHFVTQRLDPEERKLYEDPEALTDVFMASLNTIATPERPLVILFDTYELIEQCDRWFRKRALPQTGIRLIWVLAGRAGPAFIRRYRDEDELDPSLLGGIPLDTFTRPDIRNYVERRGIAEPSDEFIDRLQELSLGIPLALKAWFELYQNDVELPPADPNASTERYAIVQRVTRRFLSYCDDDDRHLSSAERQRREATRNHIFTLLLLRHTDVEALATMWECTSAEADQTLRDLARQFSFIFAGEREREPHALVKQFVRDYLREHQRMPFLSNAIERLVAHYISRMREREGRLFPDSATVVLSDVERTALASERDVYRQNLQTIQIQIAKHGSDMAAPVKLLNEHKAYEQAIAKLDERLKMPAEQPVPTQRRPLWNDETWRHLLLDFANALCWADRSGERVVQTIVPLFIEAQEFHRETTSALLDIAQEFQAGWTADPLNLYSTVVALRELWRNNYRLTPETIQRMVESVRHPVQHTDTRNQLQMVRNVLQLATKNVYPRSIDTQLQVVEKAVQSTTVLWQLTETQKAILYLQCGRYLLRIDDKTSFENCSLAQTLVDKIGDLLPDNGGDLARSLADTHDRLGDVYYFDLKQYAAAETQYRHAVTIDVEYVRAYAGLGNLYHRQKVYEKAVTAFQQAIDLDPMYVYAGRRLGDVYRDLMDYEQAEAHYQQAISVDPENAWIYDGLGELYYIQELYDQAIEAFQQAITLAPTYVYPMKRLGDIYRDLAQYEQAEAQYQQAIAIDPEYIKAHIGLGELYFRQRKYNNAIPVFQQAINLDSANAYSYWWLGNIYCDLAKYEQAEVQYQQAIAIDPEYVDAHIMLGEVYYAQKLYDRAVVTFQQAITLDPTHVYAVRRLGDVYRELGQYEEAEAHYQQAIAIDPDNAWIYCGLGGLYYRQKAYDQAIKYFQQAITLDPKYVYVLERLGDVYAELADFEQSELYYQRILKIDPQYIEAYDHLAILYLIQEKYDRALRISYQALEVDSSNHSYALLGYIYRLLHQYDTAVKYYTLAIQFDADNYRIFLGIAYFERLAGHNAKADEFVEQARKLLPDDDYYGTACLESIAGNIDSALEALEIALKDETLPLLTFMIDWVRKDPDLAFIRDDPRFAALLEQYSAAREE